MSQQQHGWKLVDINEKVGKIIVIEPVKEITESWSMLHPPPTAFNFEDSVRKVVRSAQKSTSNNSSLEVIRVAGRKSRGHVSLMTNEASHPTQTGPQHDTATDSNGMVSVRPLG